ncbi:putative C-type lectin domain family 20 member A [Arvicanthis niloticus]|uniref:putative C-type lectin domain family 20 member A n=1 Tax=Arvicanthis niloticus TaxID=61156 RepID=UPI00403C45C0
MERSRGRAAYEWRSEVEKERPTVIWLRSVGDKGEVGVGSHVVIASPAPALQLVSNSKTFHRVDEPRTWREAMWYCQEHYTDLADLQSMNSLANIMAVYSYTSSIQAWIGLFYDVRISGLSWSSGSTFTMPTWSTLPVFREGVCATLYSWYRVPALGAASCTDQKPFICYFDPAVGHRISLVSPVKDLITLPEEAEVKIGGQTFIRIKQTMTWLSALNYCRSHYTDLADLQKVTDKDKETLKSIINNEDAWIGLYFNVKINNLTWSSEQGSSIPEWLQEMPMFGQGLCAGLRTFANHPPQIYALLCPNLKPFICFNDPSIGHRKSAEIPPVDTSSPRVTQDSKVPTRTTSRPNTGTSSGPIGASQALDSTTWIPNEVTHEPIVVSSGTRGFSTCDITTPAPNTMSLTALQPQGMVSINPLATSAHSGETKEQATSVASVSRSTTEIQDDWPNASTVWSLDTSTETAGSLPGTTTAMTTIESGTFKEDTTTTTQAQHLSSPKYPESKKKPGASESEHSFGILKADFTIPTLRDPEEMKDELLSEIQEVLKLVLGHEEFTLKWIGFEVNKK